MAQPIIKHPIIDPLLRLLVLYTNNIVISHILAMASIEDLIATISGGLHAGQQGNDIRDLHVSFSRPLSHPDLPNFSPLSLFSISHFTTQTCKNNVALTLHPFRSSHRPN